MISSIPTLHPLRGDLAFDGQNGVISVLLRQDQANAPPPSGAVLRGMDVFFDDLPVNFGTAQTTAIIHAAPKSCEAPGN